MAETKRRLTDRFLNAVERVGNKLPDPAVLFVLALAAVTPCALLTPMLIFVAILSHTAADAGYVLVIPLGGVIFQAAGRHPLAGIAATFVGVGGAFSANPLPSGLDPLLQGLTQEAAQIIDPGRELNPLCN